MLTENMEIQNNYNTIDEYKSLIGSKTIINGTIVKFNPEIGIYLDLGNNIVGFIPVGDFEDGTISANASVVSKIGKNIKAYVQDVLDDNIVKLNRAKLQKDYKSSELERLDIGTIFKTNVVSIAPFGVFVDMGYGVLGLLPIGDISVARFSNLKEIFKVGDTLYVVYKGKADNGYVVSHKELLGTWQENLDKFKNGEYCSGVIREIKPYGAFIEITPNLTGLADFPEDFEVHMGDSVCVLLKSSNSEKLKVKLHIVSVLDTPYKVKYDYVLTEGNIKEWVYTPKESAKQIKTVFDGKFKK